MSFRFQNLVQFNSKSWKSIKEFTFVGQRTRSPNASCRRSFSAIECFSANTKQVLQYFSCKQSKEELSLKRNKIFFTKKRNREIETLFLQNLAISRTFSKTFFTKKNHEIETLFLQNQHWVLQFHDFFQKYFSPKNSWN